MNMSGTYIETEEVIDLQELLTDSRKLVVYNDDVNTFDHVIDCLIDICKHDTLQAEQLTTLIHYKGRAIVKEGDEEKIKPMCTALTDKGLSAVIE
jgi:ATP-dependent Clp protease adaptor protein ClpS